MRRRPDLEVPNFSVDWPAVSASNLDKVAEDLPKTLKKVRKLMGRLHRWRNQLEGVEDLLKEELSR